MLGECGAGRCAVLACLLPSPKRRTTNLARKVQGTAGGTGMAGGREGRGAERVVVGVMGISAVLAQQGM